MVYNPLDRPVRRTLRLPLYYTGLTEVARIREAEGEPRSYRLDRGYNVDVPIDYQRRERSYVRGVIGRGNGRIYIDTGSGSVRIHPR